MIFPDVDVDEYSSMEPMENTPLMSNTKFGVIQDISNEETNNKLGSQDSNIVHKMGTVGSVGSVESAEIDNSQAPKIRVSDAEGGKPTLGTAKQDTLKKMHDNQ